MDRMLRARTALAALAVVLAVAAIGLGDAARGAVSTASAAAATSVVGAASSAEGVDDFTFRSMDAQYTLGRADDGTSTLQVVETFVADFPDTDQNHGMRRAIPDSYDGQPLFPALVSITDQNGTPRAADTDSDDGFFVMTSRADAFVHGAQTYVFTYTLRNVTWTFADTGDDEFYWDVNGTAWPQAFGRVTATLHVDPALTGALTGRVACYQGAQGSTDRCDISSPSGAPFVSAQSTELQPYQTMTIAVGFDKGTFTLFDSSYVASPWGWAQGAAGLGVVGVLVFAIVRRRSRLRDAPGRPTIIAEYTPPERIDALQSAVLLGRTTKAVAAEVLEQAVAGSIRIVEGAPKLWGGVKLQAELVDRSRADGDGRMLLDGLFGADAAPGAVFEFGRSDTRFSKSAQRMLSWADKELTAQGLRRALPRGTRAWPIVAASVVTALVWVLGIAALNAGVHPAVPFIVMFAAVIALVAVGVLVARRPLTAAGAETRDHLAGLRQFIEWAEADRIRTLQSPSGAERVAVDVDDPRQMLRLYETLLPYAVIFGQEKEWAERIAVYYGTAAPYWYVGTHGFDASSFSAGIGSLSSSASSSSSTSGGSGGGGSAGGGGGGGGGGGV